MAKTTKLLAWSACAAPPFNRLDQMGALSMTKVTFPRARATDLSAIIAFWPTMSWGASGRMPALRRTRTTMEAFRVIDADRNQLQAVVVLDGEVIGNPPAHLHPRGSPARGRGAARSRESGSQQDTVVAAGKADVRMGDRPIFEWAIAQYRTRGCGLAQLTTERERPNVLRFYEKLGFAGSHIGFKMTL